MSRASGQVLKKVHTTPQVVASLFDLAVGEPESFEGNRHGAHAAVDSRRQKLDQKFEEDLGVFKSLGSRPIRQVNLLFHSTSMKFAVRKAIDGKYITIVTAQPLFEMVQNCRLGKFPRGAFAEAKANSVGAIGRNRSSDSQRVLFQ